MKNVRASIIATFALAIVAQVASAYDRTAALDYATTWCRTDKSGDGKVDFVNSPLRGGPYTWFFHVKFRLFGYEFFDTRITRTNDGDNTKLAEDGFDCTNFVSQALKAGGLGISGTGPGGTIIRVRQLAEFLRPISEVTTLTSASSSLPANLSVGDVIEFRGLHITFVASVNPLKLVFHSNDRCPEDNVSLANFPASAFPATVFHIVGTPVGSLESTPPTMTVLNEAGNVVAPEKATNAQSLTVQAADSGSGLRGLHLTRGTPLVDRIQDFLSGAGSYVFVDDTFRGGSFSYTLPQNLAEGLYFVEGFDAAGNYSMQPIGIDRTKPALNVFAAGSPIQPGGATSGNELSFVADDTAGGAAVLVSGLGRLEIYKGDPNNGGALLASNATLYEATHTYTASDAGLSAMSNLPEGEVFVRAFDQAGNDTLVRFVIDKTPPTAEVFDGYKDLADGGYSNSTHINVFADDGSAGSGIRRISVSPADTGEATGGPGVRNFSEPHPERLEMFPASDEPPLKDGRQYRVSVEDFAGNRSSMAFTVDRTPPELKVHEESATGALLEDEATTSKQKIHLTVRDGVGVVKVTVLALDSDFARVFEFEAPGEKEVLQPVSDLDDSRYWIVAEDAAGNVAVTEISVNPDWIAPQLSILAPPGVILIEARGRAQAQPVITEQFQIDFAAVDGISGLSSIVVTDGLGRTVASAVGLPPGTHSRTVGALGLGPGFYTARVVNRDGYVTTAKFRVVSITQENLTNSAAVYDHATGSFTGTMNFSLTAQAGLQYFELLDLFGKHIDVKTVGGGAASLDFPFEARPPEASGFLGRITDIEGNTVPSFVRLALGGLNAVMSFTQPLEEPEQVEMVNVAVEDLGDGAHGLVATSSQEGRVTSQAVDLLAHSLMRGAAALAGPLVDPFTQQLTTYVPVMAGAVAADKVTEGEISDDFILLKIRLTVISEQTTVLYDGSLRYVTIGTAPAAAELRLSLPAPRVARIGSQFSWRLGIEEVNEFIPRVFCAQVEGSFCRAGRRLRPFVAGVQIETRALSVATEMGQMLFTLAPESLSGGLSLGHGITVTGIRESAYVHAMPVARLPDRGFINLPSRTAFVLSRSVAGDGSSVNWPLQVSVAAPVSGLSPHQLSGLRVVVDGIGVVPSTVQDNRVRFSLNLSPSEPVRRFAISVPELETPVSSGAEGLVFQANEGVSVIRIPPDDPEIRRLLRKFLAQGKVPISQIYEVGPTGAKFSPAAYLSITAGLAGVDPSKVAIFQFTRQGVLMRMPDNVAGSSQVSARVPSLSSLFAVMAETTPVLLPPEDVSAPVTRLVLDGPQSRGEDNRVMIATFTRVSFAADDPPFPGEPASGVAETSFSLSSSAPLAAFLEPFELLAGTYTLRFRSVDHAGNVEPERGEIIVVDQTPGLPPGPAFISARSAGSLHVAWDGGGNGPGTSYELRFGRAGGLSHEHCAAPEETAERRVGALEAVLDGLEPAAAYWISVCNVRTLAEERCAAPLIAVTGAADLETAPPFVRCGAPDMDTGGGESIAADSQGRLWQLLRDRESFKLARFADPEEPEFVVILPAAVEEGRWTLRVEGETAYAIGTSTATSESPQVTVYRVSPASGIEGFRAAIEDLHDISVAMDASGDIWITGGIASEGLETVRLGLWHYCLHENTLTRKAIYERGGRLDVGGAIRLVGQEIWVAGFSRAPSTGAVDLALWKFGHDGALLAGPILRPGYFGALEVGEELSQLRLEAVGGRLFVAAPRPGGELGFLKFDGSGTLLLEKAWRSASEQPAWPRGMIADGVGRLVIAGAVGGAAALWRYGQDGTLQLAQHPVDDVGDARDLASVGGDIWLAVEKRSRPYRFAAGPDLQGEDRLIFERPEEPPPPPPPPDGELVLRQVVGGKETLQKPHGVAIGPEGRVYAADTNNDRIAIFSADGSWIAGYGISGRKVEPFLNKPHSLAVDGAGNIYVADTNHHRVVKYSPEGALLLELGDIRRKGAKQFHAGSEPGQFRRPQGVALGPEGRIFVADTGNSRVQVFDAAGTFIEQQPTPHEPMSIAVDGSGRVYTRPSPGLAVSADGGTLWVSDPEENRVLRYDAEGELKEGLSGHDMNRPMGLALTASGELWVADRNNDRLLRFGPAGEFIPPAKPPAKPKRNLHAEAVIKAGRVIREDGARVELPQGALVEEHPISVSAVGDADPDREKKEEKRKAKGLKPGSEEVEYGPEGLAFSLPVTIALPYDPGLGLDPKTLKVHYWNPKTKEWEPFESTVDTAQRLVSAKTTHFSLYQVLGQEGGGGGNSPAAAPFGLREIFAYPNPARPGQRPIFRADVGAADSVSVNIYDLTGQPVHSASFNWEYAWDTSKVGSGVYLYVVTAKRAGHAEIRKVGKVGIIK